MTFTTAPIAPPASILPSRETGAVVEFLGVVREMEHGTPVPGLFYEAYEPMARRQLDAILHDLSAQHPCSAITFIHRTGFIPVGEASLFIRVCSAHRGPAFAFCEALIDRLKQDVPVWKHGR